jgi:hypothetical protein
LPGARGHIRTARLVPALTYVQRRLSSLQIRSLDAIRGTPLRTWSRTNEVIASARGVDALMSWRWRGREICCTHLGVLFPYYGLNLEAGAP